MTYAQRYFAFVDILGFSDLIRQSENGKVEVGVVHQLLEIVHKPDQGDGFVVLGSDFRSQSISDAVAISTASNENGLLHALHALKELSLRMLEKGYFVRGALVHGGLFHEKQTVFGPALLEAYRLESSVARFPRIMINRDVIDRVQMSGRKQEFSAYIDQAADGPYAVNLFHGITDAEHPTRQTRLLPVLEEISARVEQRLNEAVDNPSHFEKAQWFARYWNSKIPNWASSTCVISGPGLEKPVTMSDVAGYVFAMS